MAGHRKTYFLAPTPDVPPDGPIKLGSIIENARLPDQTVLNNDVLPIPASLGPYTTVKHGYSNSENKSYETSPGVFAEFMQLAGFGLELGGTYKNSHGATIYVKSLETQTFSPTRSYITQAMQAPEVQDFVEKKRLWIYRASRPLYMISGVKIARGASSSGTKAREHGAHIKLNANLGVLTGTGAPVNVGPSLDQKKSRDSSISYEGSDDFVYAYRLSKIVVRRKTMEVEVQPEVRGAALSYADVIEEDDGAALQYTTEDVEAVDCGCISRDMEDEHGVEISIAREP